MPTDFEKRVWEACKKIPLGKVSTYGQIAKAIGKPKAARAVGNALNKSPGFPKVPCHRGVCGNGKGGGFAKGPGKKEELLRVERIRVEKGKVINLNELLYRF